MTSGDAPFKSVCRKVLSKEEGGLLFEEILKRVDVGLRHFSSRCGAELAACANEASGRLRLKEVRGNWTVVNRVRVATKDYADKDVLRIARTCANPEAALGRYIRNFCRNIATQVGRKARRESTNPNLDVGKCDSEDQNVDLVEWIHWALSTLSPEEASAVKAYFLLQLGNQKEVARLLSTTRDKLQAILLEALTKLRELAKRDFDAREPIGPPNSSANGSAEVKVTNSPQDVGIGSVRYATLPANRRRLSKEN